uniref:Superkiller protein 3 n=1 Tax=Schizophyllum commune (strain H4-8 / FGSC 9210) TaxID=578458 RepID=D8QCZ7_SCHCM
MSSAFAKQKLKAARDALGKKKYDDAKNAASQVLEYEPDNYNAHVFLGLACLELGEHDNSEKAYRTAIDLNPSQLLAWQGLSKFYEKTGASDKYLDTLTKLADLHAKAGDATKCAEALQKFLDIRRANGSRQQLVDALGLFLPGSPYYDAIATLEPPDFTNPESSATFFTQSAVHNSLPILEEMVALLEQDEAEQLKREVEKRRTRLGAAGPEQLRREVGREIWGTSKLPTLYNEIINHPKTSDELRRETESKVLFYKRQYLFALPAGKEKDEIRGQVEEMANGVVVLQVPDELAWTTYLELKDCATVEEYEYDTLRQYLRLFPTLPLGSMIKGYLSYFGIPLEEEEEDDEDVKKAPIPGGDEDPFDLVMDAFASLSDSTIACRLIADIYLHEEDWAQASKTSSSGLELVSRVETNYGKKAARTRMGFNVVLATSLVHLFPPKHHARALPILDDVLSQDPLNVPALMGRAYVLEAAQNWNEAAECLNKVVSILPDDLDDGLRAKEELAWCRSQQGDLAGAVEALSEVKETLNGLEGRELDQARCLWRIGKCYWDMGGDDREKCYPNFIQALKKNPSYAPAFTSLGIYYSECASPPDPTRASKCFQKAFELDAREAEAGRRLAEAFADEGEWDLVEVVARRTIEGEGGLDAGVGASGAAAKRFLPTNAWAWKAIGVVDLVHRNYPSAIQSFQIALRAHPDDAQLWVRLGEAYGKAGRHAAAIKALEHAQELAPDDWVCKHLIADLRRQTGHFAEAVAVFEGILESQPGEVGVVAALAQTYLDLGRSEAAGGFTARSEESLAQAAINAMKVIREHPGFRAVAWKVVGDAAFALSEREAFDDPHIVLSVLNDILMLLEDTKHERLEGIVQPPYISGRTNVTNVDAATIAVLAYDLRVDLNVTEKVARASAWFDLGTALRSWLTKLPSSSSVGARAEKLALSCMTSGLREDPANETYWMYLGDAHFTSQPKTAQHCYIRALDIDNKVSVLWTRLGLLYLHHDDVQLANEALYRAQVLDPDYTLAWIGQAMVAIANDHEKDATTLLEHAVGLSATIVRCFSLSLFIIRTYATLRAKASGTTNPDLVLPVFDVLERYLQKRPNDPTGLHLSALVHEALGHAERGADLAGRAVDLLEALYEETEDSGIERQYTIATSNRARMQLALGAPAEAVAGWETVSGLLEGGEGPEVTTLRVQAGFGIGLARMQLGELEGALEAFQGALEEAGEDLALRGHVAVLLAQALWSLGTEEGRESAKAQLLDWCVPSTIELVVFLIIAFAVYLLILRT